MRFLKYILVIFLICKISYASVEDCMNNLQSKNYVKAIKIAKSGLRWDKYDFNYNMCAAISFLSLGEPSKALTYLQNAKKSANTEYQKEALYNYIGVSYDMIGNKSKALNYYTKAYKIAKKIGDSQGKVDNLSNIAHIFYSKGYYKSALEIYEKALKQNPHSATILNNIALCYANLKDYKNALKYYTKASDIFSQNKDFTHQGATYLNIGVLYLKLLDFKDAKNYLEKGIELVKNSKYWQAIGYQYMGWYYDNNDNKIKANYYYQKALNLATDIGAKGLINSINKNMSSDEDVANEY